MKAIIDGKLYDTATATAIINFKRQVDKGLLGWNDKLRWTPMHLFTLYKTQKGAYFEYDQDDQKIDLVSEKKARAIVQQLDPDKYIELYGAVEEG